MSEENEKKRPIPATQLGRAVGAKAARKIKARRKSVQGVWFGLGMMGLIGWSVVIPTFLGAVLGMWLDNRYPGAVSWTLTLLIIGLCLGCLNAWHWMAKENLEIRKDEETEDE